METSFSRDPLGFLIEQDRIEAEENMEAKKNHQPGTNYYHALHDFMNDQIIKVQTIKKVKNVIMTPFKELLEWLAISPDGLKTTQDFGKLLFDFFESVNKTRAEIKEAEFKSKNGSKNSTPSRSRKGAVSNSASTPGPKRKMSNASSSPNLLNLSDLKSNLRSKLESKLANRSSQN